MGWLNPLRRIFNWTLSSSTYDAVHAKNKRSAPTGILRSEDAELTPTDRRKMLSASRSLHRNFTMAAWPTKPRRARVVILGLDSASPSK